MGTRDVSELHPCLRRGADELEKQLGAKGYLMEITATYRSNEEQNSLYSQGRTMPGKIVTNAKGGESTHNYRMAFDICEKKTGYNDLNFFNTAGEIWCGMSGWNVSANSECPWGGGWASFRDNPHMEYMGGLSIEDLQNGKTLPIDAKMPWELSMINSDIVVQGKNIIYDGKQVKLSIVESADGKEFIYVDDFGKIGLWYTKDSQGDLLMLDDIIKNVKIVCNGIEITVKGKLMYDKNYIELQDLSKLGFEVSYDTNNRTPILNSK